MKLKLQLLAIVSVTFGTLHAQEKPADPYREGKAPSNVASVPKDTKDPFADPGEPLSVPVDISLCWETFSLPLDMAAKLQRQQLTDPELYKQLVAAVEKETAKQENFTLVRCRSGQKATVESISEQIYATEYEPARLSNSEDKSGSSSEDEDEKKSAPNVPKPSTSPDQQKFAGLIIPALPTAFDFKNVGHTLEVEPTLSEDNRVIDLRIIPEVVTYAGKSTAGEGVSKTEMPIFEKQSLESSFVLRINQPFLMGTMNRPPISAVDPDSANRVWFAFMTATLKKP